MYGGARDIIGPTACETEKKKTTKCNMHSIQRTDLKKNIGCTTILFYEKRTVESTSESQHLRTSFTARKQLFKTQKRGTDYSTAILT